VYVSVIIVYFRVSIWATNNFISIGYTEITVYISVIMVYFSVGIREQYVKFGVRG